MIILRVTGRPIYKLGTIRYLILCMESPIESLQFSQLEEDGNNASKFPHRLFARYNMAVSLCGGDRKVQKACLLVVMNASWPPPVLAHIFHIHTHYLPAQQAVSQAGLHS